MRRCVAAGDVHAGGHTVPVAELVEVTQEDVDAVDLPKLFRARKLFGWPVGTLDALHELRSRAHDFEITVDQWREEAAVLREQMPEPPDARALAATRKAAREAWFDEFDARTFGGPADRLMGRLHEFDAPPQDEDLWADLVEARSKARAGMREHRSDWADRCEHLARLLTRDGATHDLVSGLPWTVLGRYRWVEFERRGLVPAPLDLARERAEAAAQAGEFGDVVLERHRLLTGRAGAERGSFAALNASMLLHSLTGLGAELHHAAGVRRKGRRELVEAFDQLWQSPAMEAFLLERTQAGWPSRYARARRPVPPTV